jgi:hypothetical protein
MQCGPAAVATREVLDPLRLLSFTSPARGRPTGVAAGQ